MKYLLILALLLAGCDKDYKYNKKLDIIAVDSVELKQEALKNGILTARSVIDICENALAKTQEDCQLILVKSLAQSGKICEVYGHWWEYTEGLWNRKRTCRICQKYQTHQEKWEDSE